MKPMIGMLDGCACVSSGHAAATPAASVMNSRRLMGPSQAEATA